MGSLLYKANEIMEDYKSVDEYIKKTFSKSMLKVADEIESDWAKSTSKINKESKEDIQKQITQHYNAIKKLKKRL